VTAEHPNQRVYEAIARSLRDFGYPDVIADMVRETDEAPSGEQPHGVVSMFARRQLDEAREAGLLPSSPSEGGVGPR
jgi:hypothetical protein